MLSDESSEKLRLLALIELQDKALENSVKQLLASGCLRGDHGKSAYEIAVENGFVGDETAWLKSLEGEAGVGNDGKSAYEIAVDNGFVGDETAWLKSLEGEAGVGIDGKSAYEIAVDNGFVGSAKKWIESLKGKTGGIGPMPRHRWNGTKLSFEIAPGIFGKEVDLKGLPGQTTFAVVENKGGNSAANWNLIEW